MDKKNKIIMGWTPKAGCTVAIQMFLDHMGILEEALEPSILSVHDYLHKVFFTKFGIADFSNPEYFKFKVVRNPYDRAISSFLHYLKYNAPQGLSFNEYLSRLIQVSNRFNDNHHQPQIDGRHYDKIIKIENLESDIQEINNMVGTSFKTHYSSSHHHVKLEKSNNFFGELTFTTNMKFKDIKFMATGNPLFKTSNMVIPHYDDFYNETLRLKVQKLYCNDFCTFGYSF